MSGLRLVARLAFYALVAVGVASLVFVFVIAEMPR